LTSDPKSPTEPEPETQASLERSALFVATVTSFMGPFMISSVNVALPAIQNDLQMNAVQLSWVATSYLLAMSVALIPAGKLADIHGRKKVFSSGLIVYTLGATAAAFVSGGGPSWMSDRWAWINLGMLGAIWLSTTFLQSPAHAKLTSGFAAGPHLLLVRSNWLRTVLWSARSLLLLTLLARRI